MLRHVTCQTAQDAYAPRRRSGVGSCPNHCRNAVLGEMPLIHSSMATVSFVIPRGQSRSINIRAPSPVAGLHMPLQLDISRSDSFTHQRYFE